MLLGEILNTNAVGVKADTFFVALAAQSDEFVIPSKL
jgi:hypothetical protein